MSLYKKLLGFAAVFALIPAAYAVTARPAVVGTMAASRLPSIRAYVNTANGGTSGTASTAVSEATQKAIDAYVECLYGDDVCGETFEECTTKTLFFAQKAACASTLLTMPAAALTSLYGSATTTAYANKNSDGQYTYPTDGSVLGQMIAAAQIANRYSTSDCVRRYTTCLRRDDVCGADFELCTSNREFTKQKLFCESTLARCEVGGIRELFGADTSAGNPTAASRLGIMIQDGADLAAVNAIATCYKVADQCILNACSSNPYKCKEGASTELVKTVTNITDNKDGTTTTTTENIYGAVNRAEISGFIKQECLDTIGGNKFCYATSALGDGRMPTDAQLIDPKNRDEVFVGIVNGDGLGAARWNDAMRTKVDNLIEQFDRATKTRCKDTIVECAMRTCGEGSGSACYASAFAANGVQSVANANTKPGIKSGCEAIVNNDLYCKYAAAQLDIQTGSLLFPDGSLFDVLFTDANDTTTTKKPDAVGAVAELNSKLSLSYSASALTAMARQCQTVATGCVRSLCGADFTNCYRNRTDVFSTITNTGDLGTGFDQSMNKVGGVLDYTIVVGLCLDTVKNNQTCAEHINAEIARTGAGRKEDSVWGGKLSARAGWIDAGNASKAIEVGDGVQDTDENGNNLCYDKYMSIGICGAGHQEGNEYLTYDDSNPVMISDREYAFNAASETIFRNLVRDLEMEAQAKYNAKLTAEQNQCMAGNRGGVMARNDTGSIFQWVKLRGNRVPANYTVDGLKTTQMTASNDLYGSFCRIRVSLQSDDKNIQERIRAGESWATAYFAAGDAFTCGSWIPSSELEEIANTIGDAAHAAERERQRGTGWLAPVLGGILGAGGGVALQDQIQKNGLGGIFGTNNKQNNTVVTQCTNQLRSAINQLTGYQNNNDVQNSELITSYLNGDASVTIYTVRNRQGSRVLQSQITAALTDMNASLSSNACGKTTSIKSDQKWIGAAAGALTVGTIAWVANDQAREANKDEAKRAAEEEWMNSVGKKIHCYIGPDEIGTYGDVISTELE